AALRRKVRPRCGGRLLHWSRAEGVGPRKRIAPGVASWESILQKVSRRLLETDHKRWLTLCPGMDCVIRSAASELHFPQGLSDRGLTSSHEPVSRRRFRNPGRNLQWPSKRFSGWRATRPSNCEPSTVL